MGSALSSISTSPDNGELCTGSGVHNVLSIRADSHAVCECDSSDGTCGLDVFCVCDAGNVCGLQSMRRVAKSCRLLACFTNCAFVDMDAVCRSEARAELVPKPLMGHHFWKVDLGIEAELSVPSEVAVGIWTSEQPMASRRMVCALSSTGMLYSNGALYKVTEPFSSATIAMHVDATHRRVSFVKNFKLVCTVNIKGSVFCVLLKSTVRQCSVSIRKAVTLNESFSLLYMCCCAIRKLVHARDMYSDLPIPSNLKEILRQRYPWLLCGEYAVVLRTPQDSANPVTRTP